MLGIFLDHFSTLFPEAESVNPIEGPPSVVVLLVSFLWGSPVSASQSWN